MIVITGATGTVGGHLLAQLSESGRPFTALVRASSRDKLPAGVDATVGDLAEPASLHTAFADAERLFLLTPDLPGEEKLRLEANAIDAAATTGVRQIVYLSGLRELDHTFSRLHRESELRLERSGVAWTHLRCSGFMSNILFSVESIRSDGAVPLPTGTGRVAAIDPQDIAAVAVQALTGDGHEKRAYTLTGAEALSSADQAAVLSAVLGRRIVHVDITEADARAAMLAHGAPEEFTESLLEVYAAIKAGRNEFLSPDVETVLGRKPRSFHTFVEENAAAFG